MCYSQNPPDMNEEIEIAVNFLMKVVNQNRNSKYIAPAQLALLHKKLCEVLTLKYLNHWFPDFPTRGSGYRCIRINGHLDPLVTQAGEASGLTYNVLRSLFPPELTLWVDPREVAYRFGENGSVCTLLDSNKQSFKGRPTTPSYSMDFNNFNSAKHSPTSSPSSSVPPSPPMTPSRSPADHMMRSRKSGYLYNEYNTHEHHKMEFKSNAMNVSQLYPLSAYMC